MLHCIPVNKYELLLLNKQHEVGWGNTREGGETQERVGKHKRGWGNTREGGETHE